MLPLPSYSHPCSQFTGMSRSSCSSLSACGHAMWHGGSREQTEGGDTCATHNSSSAESISSGRWFGRKPFSSDRRHLLPYYKLSGHKSNKKRIMLPIHPLRAKFHLSFSFFLFSPFIRLQFEGERGLYRGSVSGGCHGGFWRVSSILYQFVQMIQMWILDIQTIY